MRMKSKRRIKWVYVSVDVLLIIAYLCRFPDRLHCFDPALSRPLGILRSVIYLALFLAWGLSLRNRIIHPRVRRFLSAIAALILFWFIARTLRYHFVTDENLSRYLWYSYYPPMLLIPAMAALVAMTLGMPEASRLPRHSVLLLIPTALLALLVLTNDLHQLVFTFPEDAPVWVDPDNGYAAGYFLVIGWMLFCALFMLLTLLKKCRLPHSRKRVWLPLLPVVLLLLYMALYYSQVSWLRFVFGDMTTLTCLLYAATLEICIGCGLIQSNTRYGDLLLCCTLGVRLTDEFYRTLLASHSARDIPPAVLRQTENGPVSLEGGVRLSGAPVRDGYVLWTEDVSKLTEVLDSLEDIRESLVDSNALLREEYALKAREAHIAEQDRIYNLIQRETAARISLLDELTGEFERTSGEAERRKLLGKMTVIGAYLKRRSNLIFLADKSPLLPEKELTLTFGESLDNLELYGVTCGLRCERTGPVPAQPLAALYDFFEEAVERCMDTMTSLAVHIWETETDLCLCLNTDADSDLAGLAGETVTVLRDEDGEWQLTMTLRKGGEAA